MAAAAGNIEAVDEVNRADEHGRTQLYIACQNGQVDAARLLLDKGAAVDRADRYGATPLYVACQEGKVEAARLLLENGAEVDRAVSKGWQEGQTPLFIACEFGYVDAARLLLDKGADVNRAEKDYGATPLHVACREGHVETARLLLTNGAAVDRALEGGETPLWSACRNGHVDVVRLLLDKGAEVDRADKEGWTPLYVACQFNRVDAVRLLLDNGAEVNRATKGGATPLFIACQNGHIDAVRLLLDEGAEVDRADKDGRTPLDAAKRLNDNEAVVTLLEYHISKAKERSGEDDDNTLTSPQVRALKSENASLKAELARVKDREERSFQESITRLEWLLDRTDAWKPHEHSNPQRRIRPIALGFGLGALRGRATTLTDATLDPRMWQILDAALDVGRRGIGEAEWRCVQTIYLMKNNRRGVHTDARNIGRSSVFPPLSLLTVFAQVSLISSVLGIIPTRRIRPLGGSRPTMVSSIRTARCARSTRKIITPCYGTTTKERDTPSRTSGLSETTAKICGNN